MNSYETGMSAFNKFRKNYKLDVIWPPPVNHISSFIAFLAYNSYTPSTAKTYVSALSFSLKCKGLQDTTPHFIAKQMLKGMDKLYATAYNCPNDETISYCINACVLITVRGCHVHD
jgi:hypothetical protein